MRLDQRDPRKAFVFGVLFVKHDLDPGYQQTLAEQLVRETYRIESRGELLAHIERAGRGSSSTPAYEAFHAIVLARVGMAVELVSQDESWQLAARAGRLVQEAYDGWMSYGMGYIDGHLEHRSSQGDSAESLRKSRRQLMGRMTDCSQSLWGRMPFSVTL